jgi:hypothetical protein
MRTVGALLLGVAVAGAPALTYAQHSGGGGGGGGGGHFSGGGGGHFSGGGHVMGAGGHYYGGYGSYGGGHAFAAPHFGAGGYAGAHYVTASRVGAGGHYVYPGHPIGPGAPGIHPGAPVAPGTAYWHGGNAWVGGYWHGAYWPHVWFYPGYAWYLPVLPLGYATFWWGGVPYYYSNNLYYTWSPANNGYVVTDPPPAGGDNTAIDPNAAYENQGGAYDQTQPPPAGPAQPPPVAPAPYNGAAQSGGSAGDVFLYPRNGQSEAQQQNDRYECHGWAVNQTGFDPTRGQPQPGADQEYRRAMIACLDARGYSAR